MTEEFDIDEAINDEWGKLLDYIEENFSGSYKTLKDMQVKHGKLMKQLFEQGYRSGWNGATGVLSEGLEELCVTEVRKPH
jgi:hypothetical protein